MLLPLLLLLLAASAASESAQTEKASKIHPNWEEEYGFSPSSGVQFYFYIINSTSTFEGSRGGGAA